MRLVTFALLGILATPLLRAPLWLSLVLASTVPFLLLWLVFAVLTDRGGASSASPPR